MKKLSINQLTQTGGFCSYSSLKTTSQYVASALLGGLAVHLYHQNQKAKSKGIVNTIIQESADAYDFLSNKALPATKQKLNDVKDFVFGSESAQ